MTDDEFDKKINHLEGRLELLTERTVAIELRISELHGKSMQWVLETTAQIKASITDETLKLREEFAKERLEVHKLIADGRIEMYRLQWWLAIQGLIIIVTVGGGIIGAHFWH